MTRFCNFRWLPLRTLALATGGLGIFSNCKKSESGPFEITEIRELRPDHTFEQPVLTTDSATRFGYSARPAEASNDNAPRLVWQVPKGWKEIATTAMRDANLRFGPHGEGECYLARLPGGGGGLAANVNRWRNQMGLDPIDAAAVEALPSQRLFGQAATLVDLEGTFEGMGMAPKPDHRLRGLILSAAGGGIFVKMTGPRALVTANIDAFDQFCRSLSLDVANP